MLPEMSFCCTPDSDSFLRNVPPAALHHKCSVKHAAVNKQELKKSGERAHILLRKTSSLHSFRCCATQRMSLKICPPMQFFVSNKGEDKVESSRPTVGSKGAVFPPKRTQHCKEYLGAHLGTPCELNCVLFMPYPIWQVARYHFAQ